MHIHFAGSLLLAVHLALATAVSNGQGVRPAAVDETVVEQTVAEQTVAKQTVAKQTVAEQFAALRKQYEKVSGGGGFSSDAERLEFVGRVYRHRHAHAVKLLEFAERHASDPIALDALTLAVWQVNTTPWPVKLVGRDAARPKAFVLIERDHIGSDKLGPLCQRVSHGYCEEYESFLRAVLAKNEHEAVLATARLSLGRFLNNRLHRIELCKVLPELAEEFGELYGEAYIAALFEQDRDAVAREVEDCYTTAVENYGDVRLAGGTVAELARSPLYEIRNLRVGKPAPEIEGEDQDGRRFKLSAYRGKVVLLDFWSHA